MASKRLVYFDNLKGALILLVVLGHFMEYNPATAGSHLLSCVADWIYTFHMPLFIFVSGLFAARTYTKEKGFRAENVLFYFSLCLIFFFLRAMEMIVWGTVEPSLWKVNFFIQSSGTWYLFAMALFALMTPFFGHIKPKVALVLSVLVAVLSGFWISSEEATFLTASRFFVYLPIFAAAYYVGSDTAAEWVKKVGDSKRLLLLRVLAACVLLGWFALLFLVPDSWCMYIRRLSTGLNPFCVLYGTVALPDALLALSRIAFYFEVAVVSSAFMLLVPRRRCFLSTWGERSLQVYILHLLLIYALDHYGFDSAMLQLGHWWIWSPFLLAPLTTALLSLPKHPVAWTGKLKLLCKKALC